MLFPPATSELSFTGLPGPGPEARVWDALTGQAWIMYHFESEVGPPTQPQVACT